MKDSTQDSLLAPDAWYRCRKEEAGDRVAAFELLESSGLPYRFAFMTHHWWWDEESSSFKPEKRPEFIRLCEYCHGDGPCSEAGRPEVMLTTTAPAASSAG